MIEFEAFHKCDGCNQQALEGDLQPISLGSLAESGHVCSMECLGTFVGKMRPHLPIRSEEAADHFNRLAAERAVKLAANEEATKAHRELVQRIDDSRKQKAEMVRARKEAIAAALAAAKTLDET